MNLKLEQRAVKEKAALRNVVSMAVLLSRKVDPWQSSENRYAIGGLFISGVTTRWPIANGT